MTVTDVRIKDVQGSVDEQGFRDYTVVYDVETNDTSDLVVTVREAAGLPQIGDAYAVSGEFDADAWLRNKTVTLHSGDESYKLWRVSCRYSSRLSINPPTLDQTEPLSLPATWSGGLLQFEREYFKDRDGEAIKNAAGEFFLDPPITGDDSRFSIVCEKYFNFGNINVFSEFKDAINDRPFWSFEEKRLKIASLGFTQEYRGNSAFIKARLEVVATEATTITWDREVLNAGLKAHPPLSPGAVFSPADTNFLVEIDDDKGIPTTVPWPLTEDGQRMPTTDRKAGKENYITAKLYRLKDFTQLGFPTQLGAPF